MPSIEGGRRSLPETARHEWFQVVSHVQESGISPPRGQTARGVRDPSTKHERSLDNPFTMADRQNRSFTRLSIISRSCPAPFPDWGRGFRDHHRWVPSEPRFFIESAKPGIELESKGEGELVGTISRHIICSGQLFAQFFRSHPEELPEAQRGQLQAQQAVRRLILSVPGPELV